MARDRRKSREKVKKAKREERLDKVNGSKIWDPTPYQAVENIRKKQKGRKKS